LASSTHSTAWWCCSAWTTAATRRCTSPSTARYASKRIVQESSAVLVYGVRQWITYSSPNLNDSHDFAQLGQAYEAVHCIVPMDIGTGQLRVLRQRPLVDWAVGWLEQHRP
jgi:aminoglycoside 3-N-acetyltransferase